MTPCRERERGGTSRKTCFSRWAPREVFLRKGEKHSQKEGQHLREGQAEAQGAGDPSQVPDSTGLHDCSFLLGILVSSVVHLKPDSAQKNLNSSQFFYRVGVGLLNTVVAVSHVSKQTLS